MQLPLKNKRFLTLFLLLTCCWSNIGFSHDFQHNESWLKPPKGMDHIGNSHGEIAVASNGEVYVSVMGKKGGIQVYNAKGKYLRNVPNAPKDIHGFVIKKNENGKEFIYGAQLNTPKIFKLTLAGNIVLNIDALSVVPVEYHNKNKKRPALRLTAADVASNGDIYVVDGYGIDFIHHFNKEGKYLTSFAGRKAPWNFNNCHKIAIDPRFTPNRLLCADRANHRLVHLTLNGDLIGTYAKDLRRPSAVDFYNDTVAVAEITGRVTLLNKSGKVLKHIGTNEVPDEINKNKTPPTKWRKGVFTSPHGISFDDKGNLYVTEYNKWGRVLRFDATSL